MPEDRVGLALKRLENCEIKVIIRGGKIVKIPCQTICLQLKDGIKEIREIPADIVNEE